MKQVLKLLAVLVILPIAGTIGFMAVEGWGFIDSLYMAMITLSTVGYETVAPLSVAGKIFIIIYMALGLSVFLYSLIQLGELAVSGKLNIFLTRRRMNRKLKSLKDHFIICGAGQMGMNVCHQLYNMRHKFVVVESDESVLAEIRRNEWLWVAGDATEDSVLKEAGIEDARCLAALLSSDATNVFVTLSARLLSRKVNIIAAASDEDAGNKLRKAGANQIVSAIAAGALKVTQLMVNPNMEEFIEIFSEQGAGIDLTVIKVAGDAPCVGKTLIQTDFRQKGVMIVGIRREGKLLLPPDSSEPILASDTLIAVGQQDALFKVVGEIAAKS